MALPLTQQFIRVSSSVDGLGDLGPAMTFSGGGGSSEIPKTRDAYTGQEITLPGLGTVETATLEYNYAPEFYDLAALDGAARVSRAATVTFQPLDTEHRPRGRAYRRKGRLASSSIPEASKSEAEAATFTLTFELDEGIF